MSYHHHNNRDHYHHHQRDQQRQGGGGGGGGGAVSARDNLRDRVIRLCDSEVAQPSAERIQELATFLLRGSLDIQVARVVVECASVQSLKLPMYAALVGVLNSKTAAFGEWVVQLCFENLSSSLEPNMLRFAAQLRLVGVLGEASLQNLFSRLCAASSADPRMEELIALALPWAASALNPTKLLEWIQALPEERPVSRYVREQLSALRKNDWHSDNTIVRVPMNWKSIVGRVHECDLSVLQQGFVFGRLPRLTTFRCFEASDSEQGLTGCDRLVTECYILDICQHFAPTIPLGVDRLLNQMPVKFRYDWILVETLLGQLIQGKTDPLYSHSLLSSLMRTQVKLAGIYGRAVGNMFRTIGEMNPDARQLFVEWFAVHLSNFAFKWDWNDWVSLVEGLPDDHPQILFIRALLGRLVRFSYWARVEKSLPPALQEYMPPYPKPSPVTIEVTDPDAAPQQVLLKVLCEAGTFSQLKAGLQTHGKELRELAKTDEAKVKLLRVVGLYWAHSEGHRLMVADSLLTTLVVDQMAIVSWIFSEHSAGSLISYAPWEILHMAVKKTVERTVFLKAQPQTDVVVSKLEKQLREEKDLFLTIFQKFAIVLEAYLEEHRGEENSWFRAVLGQMESFVRRYMTTIRPFLATLETFVFSEDCDEAIRQAYRRAKDTE